MDGTILQGLMRENGISGPYLAKAAKLSKGSIYRYYSLDTIKKATIEKLLKTVGLSMEDWNRYRVGLHKNVQKDALEEDYPGYGKTIVYHQGKNLEDLREAKGVSVTALANRLNISRRSYYNYIKQKELPPGILLEAAEALAVKVAAIKGLGVTERAFEKDIYLMLAQMHKQLASIEQHLQISNE